MLKGADSVGSGGFLNVDNQLAAFEDKTRTCLVENNQMYLYNKQTNLKYSFNLN